MATKKKLENKPLDTIDLLSKIVLPAVIAAIGLWFTVQNHSDDRNRQATEITAAATRREQDLLAAQKKQDADSDTSWTRTLISSGVKERSLAVEVLSKIARRRPFNDDLLSLIADLCEGKPELEIPPDQNACRMLESGSHPEVREAVPAAKAISPSPNVADSFKVYIQIANEDQQKTAQALKEQLKSKGFQPEDIEPVKGSVATVHTYVRFFSAPGAAQAVRVKKIMNDLGYQDVGIQDFSADTDKPLSLIEIWVGKAQIKR